MLTGILSQCLYFPFILFFFPFHLSNHLFSILFPVSPFFNLFSSSHPHDIPFPPFLLPKPSLNPTCSFGSHLTSSHPTFPLSIVLKAFHSRSADTPTSLIPIFFFSLHLHKQNEGKDTDCRI